MGLGSSVFGVDYVLMIAFMGFIAISDYSFGKNCIIKIGKKSYKYQIIVIRTCFLVLFIMAAFRGMNVANDTASYYRTFLKIQENGIQSEQRMEIGYVLLNGFLAKIFPVGDIGFYVLLFISAFVAYFPLERWIEKHSTSYAIAIIAFYFLQNASYMSAIRQAMAVGIVLTALMKYEEGKYIKCAIFIVLALTFHSSAIVCVLFFVVRKLKFDLKKFLIFISLAIVLVVTNVVSVIARIIEPETTYLVNEVGNSTSVLVSCGIYIALLALQALYVKSKQITSLENSKKVYTDDFFSFCILGATFFTILSLRGPGMTRLSLYFLIAGLPYIPNTMEKIENKKVAFIIKILFALLVWLYSYIVFKYRPEWAHVWPYYFYWQEL